MKTEEINNLIPEKPKEEKHTQILPTLKYQEKKQSLVINISKHQWTQFTNKMTQAKIPPTIHHHCLFYFPI